MSAAEPPAPGRLRAVQVRFAAVVVLLLVAHAVLSLWSASRESATYDEVAHIGAGYTHLVRHDFRLTPVAAPVCKLLAALPLLTLHPPLPRDPQAWRAGDAWTLGTNLLYGDGDGARLVGRARLPFIVLSVVLGLAVVAWAGELWGRVAAGCALFLYALSPELLAHSHYANLDLAMALATTLFLRSLKRFLDISSLRRGAVLASCFALAVVTKYSFPLLVPMGLAMVAVAEAQPPGAGGPSRARRIGRLLLAAEGAALLSWLAVWVAFGLREPAAAAEAGLTTPWTYRSLSVVSAGSRALLCALGDRHLLPEAFLNGLAYTSSIPRTLQMAYLGGKVAVGGWWYYFPVALVLKTPLPLLVLLVLTPLMGWRRGREAQALLQVVLAAAVYLAIAMTFRVSVGYRHLLPVLPLLFVWAGQVAGRMWERPRLRALVVVLLAWYALGTARVAPHFLSYFNELAGGPTGGHRFLVDSNTDWGQDLDELVRLCRRLGLERVKLSYFGSARPTEPGAPFVWLPSVTCCPGAVPFSDLLAEGDVLAVSVTNLHGVYLRPPVSGPMPTRLELKGAPAELPFAEAVAWVDVHYRPFARAGFSIFLYRLTPEWRR